MEQKAKFKMNYNDEDYTQQKNSNVWDRFFVAYTRQNTVDLYKRTLKRFLESVYGEGTDPAFCANLYFSKTRDYEMDVMKFFRSVAETKAPISYRCMISVVRMFLEDNGVELPRRTWKRITNMSTGKGAITEDRPPTNEELRRIIQHMPIQGKALFLMLSSSGMRLGEALKLQIKDINLESSPVTIDIRREYTKTKQKRWTFISDEAKEALESWLSLRDDYLKTAVGRSTRYLKSLQNEKVFPFKGTNARIIWINAVKKSRLADRDTETNRYKLHPHALRKFFRTRHKAEVDVREAIMGHAGYLTGEYRRYSVEELAEEYKKGVSGVLIYSNTEEVEKLKERVAELESQTKPLTILVKEMFQKDDKSMEKMVRFFNWWNDYVGTIPIDELPTWETIDNLR